MKTFGFLIMTMTAFLMGPLQGGDLPSGVFAADEVEQAKAKAIERGLPMVYLYADYGSR